MMRGLIALLLLLNLTTLAWQWGVFAPWGWAPHSAREPERLLNQIRPEAVRIETPSATAKRLADEAAQAENARDEIAPSSAPLSPTTSAKVLKPAGSPPPPPNMSADKVDKTNKLSAP